MELILFLSLLLLFLLTLSLSLLLIFTKHKQYSDGHKNLPPGNMGLPLVGETLEFLSTGRKGTPEKFVKDRMAKYSPDVFKTSLVGEPVAVFCGSAGNKFLFANENKLVRMWWPPAADRIFLSSMQTSMLSEELVKTRKEITGLLKPEALQNYIGIMDSIAKKHLETNWDFKKQVMVSPLAQDYTFTVACSLFLSIEDPKHIARSSEPFHDLTAGILSLPINFPGSTFNRALKSSRKVTKEILGIIKKRKIDLMERKLAPKHNILAHMLATTDENGQFMSEAFIADKIMGLLVGGFDTASSVIVCIMKYLAELPHIYDGVVKEQKGIAAAKQHGELLNWEDIQKMKYSWNVANEAMRLTPPVRGTFREAICDFNYAGFSIPKGWKLYWSTSSTHDNPDYFPEPEKFDPSRFEGNGPAPYSYVPFGGGPRMCQGQEYSRLLILVFMYNVVRRFKWEKVHPNEKFVTDPTPKPEKGLPIHLLPHCTQ